MKRFRVLWIGILLLVEGDLYSADSTVEKGRSTIKDAAVSIGMMQFSTGAYGLKLGLESGPLPIEAPPTQIFLYATHEDFRISNAYYIDGQYRSSSSSVFTFGSGLSYFPTEDKRLYGKGGITMLMMDKYLVRHQIRFGAELSFGLDLYLRLRHWPSGGVRDSFAFFWEGEWRFFHHKADKMSRKDYFNGMGLVMGVKYFF